MLLIMIFLFKLMITKIIFNKKLIKFKLNLIMKLNLKFNNLFLNFYI